MIWLFLGCSTEHVYDISIQTDLYQNEETETTEETGTESFESLPENCSVQYQDNDPVQKVGSVFVQDHLFAELLNLSYDPVRELVWGVGQGGIMLFDVSNPAQPEYRTAYSPQGWHERVYQLQLSTDRLYVTHRNNGILYYDISDPENAQAKSIFQMEGASGMTLDGDYMYVTSLKGTLHVFDVSGNEFVESTEISGFDSPWRIVHNDEALYVADNSYGLVVVNKADPLNPNISTTIEGSGGAQDVVIQENYLYIATGGLGVDIYDISAPLSPTFLRNVPTSYSALELAVDEDTLWVASQQDLIAIDIQNPENAFVHNTEETTQWAMAVDAHDGKVFVADWGYLSIFERDEAIDAGDLHLASTQVFIPDDSPAIVALRNYGNKELTVFGGNANSADISLQISSQTIPPGETVQLAIEQNGGEGGQICIASSDPDTSTQYIDIVGPEQYPIGSTAPDFSLTSLEGDVYRLNDYYGQYVVLVYFATW